MRSALAAYALLVVVAAPRLLHGRAWVDRSPRLAILAWQASGLAVLSSVLLVTVLTVLPVSGVQVDLVHLLHACAALLAAQDATSLDVAVVVAAAGLVLVLCRSGWRHTASTTRVRRQLRELVDLVTTPMHGQEPQARLLAHATPLAYCIPGRRARIVVTTGAQDALGPAELDAVLHHERAHLDGRHHLVLLWSRVLRTALPLPLFATADRETAQLVEMLADDAVRTPSGRLSLARAVLALGSGSPRGALAAGADHTGRRVDRLLRAATAPAYPTRLAATGLSLAVLSAPWLSTVPALAALSGQCPPLL